MGDKGAARFLLERLSRVLEHPLTRNIPLDDPRTTELRRSVIRQKPFLKRIYEDWYAWIASRIPHGPGAVVELGSGAGFLEEFVPGLVTSEVFISPHVRVVLDGRFLPFHDASLRAIVMVDVFHHIPDARSFLEEAGRCLKPGGRILMVEPWITSFSRLIYSLFHHEPVDMDAQSWAFPPSGPLSGANTALPWIVFKRDLDVFRLDFPDLSLTGLAVERPLSYILSGGVSLRALAPGFLYPAVRLLERLLDPLAGSLGMFARISIEKTKGRGGAAAR